MQDVLSLDSWNDGKNSDSEILKSVYMNHSLLMHLMNFNLLIFSLPLGKSNKPLV